MHSAIGHCRGRGPSVDAGGEPHPRSVCGCSRARVGRIRLGRDRAHLVRKRWTAEGGRQMIYRTLGSTGEKVSAIGVGGWHLGLKTVVEQLSIRIVRSAIDQGINFLDNIWDYNEGASELRMGKALRYVYRDLSFVLTKLHRLSKQDTANQIYVSLH